MSSLSRQDSIMILFRSFSRQIGMNGINNSLRALVIANSTHLVSSIPLSLFDYLCWVYLAVGWLWTQFSGKLKFCCIKNKSTKHLEWVFCFCFFFFILMWDKIKANLLHPPGKPCIVERYQGTDSSKGFGVIWSPNSKLCLKSSANLAYRCKVNCISYKAASFHEW